MTAPDPLAPPPPAQESDELHIPEQLPVMPLQGMVVFPEMGMPLTVNAQRQIKLVDDVLAGNRMVVVVAQKDPQHEPENLADLYEIGTAGVIVRMLRFPDNSTRVLLQGLKRVRLLEQIGPDPYLQAKVGVMEEQFESSEQLDALMSHMAAEFERMIGMVEQLPDELKIAAMNTNHPGRLADLIAVNLKLEVAERQAILSEMDLQKRLEMVATHLNHQLHVLDISGQIKAQVQKKLGDSQRDYYLREQLKAIQTELGESDQPEAELQELQEQLEKAKMPPEAKKEGQRELDRLKRMHPSSAEYSVSRTYLDWLLALPWAKATRDRLDTRRAKQILDEDHYDLMEVKERILDYLAVRKLTRSKKGSILCFVGPPGTGKTSMGRSIARAMGREFIRISLGGVRDEAEIRGHRRTYVGALPGRIIQCLRKAGTRNPVFMLDEVDKLGADFRGDPSSALLEVLDPEQNNAFSDHYLDVAFDLSRVMFITTANVLSPIPPPLRDRMEVLELPGYTTEEKIQIAQDFIVPKQTKEHGLKKGQIEIEPAAIEAAITSYTREAGLRNLERELATVCRKVARKVAEGDAGPHRVAPGDLADHLGVPKYFPDVAERVTVPGVAVGLAWTATGGEILFLEASRMPGSGQLILTGSLGDVMKESAQAAVTYVRSRTKELGLSRKLFDKTDVHIHVPGGAIPKDGPSAGVAMAVALVSLFADRPLRPFVAMTGEISLRGQVLPVGGIKEKVLAARRAHIKTVILPKRNEKDMVEVPDDAKTGLTFRFVEKVDEVIALAFDGQFPPRRTPTRTAKKKAS